MNFEQLAESVGVTRDVVKTSPHADVFSFLRPKTEEELALVQEVVDNFYDRFLKKVANGRGLTEEQVKAIAQGRVWSGRDARQNGLVDEFGGLYDAIDYAAKLAKLPAGYKVTEYPRKRKSMEFFREILGVELESNARSPFANLIDRVEGALGPWSRLDDPRGAYALIPWHLHMP
jgi:protease-4